MPLFCPTHTFSNPLLHNDLGYLVLARARQELSEALLRGASTPRHRRRFPPLTSVHVALLSPGAEDIAAWAEEASPLVAPEDEDDDEEAEPVDPLPVPPALRMTKCGKCNGIRPPRAHHCMVCGRCILKMDHHW